MDCPQCDAVMRERDRSGIKVDFCPDCKGVWLDRGELDKIIEREARDDDEDDEDRRDRFAIRRGRDDDDRPTGYRDDSERRLPADSREYPPRNKKRSFIETLTDLAGGNDD